MVLTYLAIICKSRKQNMAQWAEGGGGERRRRKEEEKRERCSYASNRLAGLLFCRPGTATLIIVVCTRPGTLSRRV